MHTAGPEATERMDMDDDRTGILQSTRRHFFSRCSMGLGQMALASLLSDGRLLKANPQASHPLAPKAPPLSSQGPVHHLSLHGGWTQPAGPV